MDHGITIQENLTMKNEKWYSRQVTDPGGSYYYGCVRFEGGCYEPTTPHGFIRPGMKVEVRRLTGAGRLAVRRVLDDGSRGGEETWKIF
jgi:hypothetical protein